MHISHIFAPFCLKNSCTLFLFFFVFFRSFRLPENTFSLYVLQYRLSNNIAVNLAPEKELYECFTFRYNLF